MSSWLPTMPSVLGSPLAISVLSLPHAASERSNTLIDCFHIARASVERAMQSRKTSGSLAHEGYLLLTSVRVVDVLKGETSPATAVLIKAGRIEAVGAEVLRHPTLGKTVTVDCAGQVLIPGLCDAHVHCTACTADLTGLTKLSESYLTAKAIRVLEAMLCRGFTTVRDTGGADYGLAQAINEGVVSGPKVLFSGHALSQTGGHGDMRHKGDDCLACGAAVRGIGRVCDGDSEVRKATRDELRKGAHCIKVMASGGVASPTDKLESTQFSELELCAIIEEAEAVGTYVSAHAYTPEAIERVVRCGAKSIEHGNYLDDASAKAMAEHKAFLVPTIITYVMLAEQGEAAGMSAESVAKVGNLVQAGLKSLEVAKANGVPICFGSDLLGDLHAYQSEEFALLSSVLSPIEVLQSATINCHELFGMHEAGRIEPGCVADLVLLDADPLINIDVLVQPETHVRMVIKDGLVVAAKRGCGLEASNVDSVNFALTEGFKKLHSTDPTPIASPVHMKFATPSGSFRRATVGTVPSAPAQGPPRSNTMR